jgi:hypothetical protein
MSLVERVKVLFAQSLQIFCTVDALKLFQVVVNRWVFSSNHDVDECVLILNLARVQLCDSEVNSSDLAVTAGFDVPLMH